jgi:AhpD family alkylhydroperoxidase
MATVPHGEPEQGFAPPSAEATEEKTYHRIMEAFSHTLSAAPEMAHGFNGLYGKLHHLELDSKHVELAYLMVSTVNGCRYCVQVHTYLGRQEGLTEAQLTQLERYQESDAYDPLQKLILRYAEDLTRKIHADPRVVAGLKQFLTEKELVELAMTVGVASMANRLADLVSVPSPH